MEGSILKERVENESTIARINQENQIGLRYIKQIFLNDFLNPQRLK